MSETNKFFAPYQNPDSRMLDALVDEVLFGKAYDHDTRRTLPYYSVQPETAISAMQSMRKKWAQEVADGKYPADQRPTFRITDLGEDGWSVGIGGLEVTSRSLCRAICYAIVVWSGKVVLEATDVEVLA